MLKPRKQRQFRTSWKRFLKRAGQCRGVSAKGRDSCHTGRCSGEVPDGRIQSITRQSLHHSPRNPPPVYGLWNRLQSRLPRWKRRTRLRDAASQRRFSGTALRSRACCHASGERAQSVIERLGGAGPQDRSRVQHLQHLGEARELLARLAFRRAATNLGSVDLQPFVEADRPHIAMREQRDDGLGTGCRSRGIQ